jgi:hypothetical protein
MPPMNSYIHENDIGTKLLIKVTDDGKIVNLENATTLVILVKKPDGTLLTLPAELETDGKDGKMYYITVAGDIDVAGNYKIQGRVTLPNGIFYTTVDTFIVHCNL